MTQFPKLQQLLNEKGFTLNDLRLFEYDEFVCLFESDLKLDAGLFYKRVTTQEIIPVNAIDCYQNGILHLSRVVQSSCLYSMRDPNCLYMNEIIYDSMPWNFIDITYIDLSWCSLMAEDLEYINKLVQKCPKLKILDLCGNRIFTIEPETMELIVEILKNVDYLDLSINGIATTAAMYSFIHNADLWRKFIFIYKPHYSKKGWYKHLEELGYGSKNTLIEDAHKKYYDKCIRK